MTTDWTPALYSRFENERTRPAADLLARVPLETPRSVVDLGCGPGNSTELLATRFPAARMLGCDTSATMLAAARKRLPSVTFEQRDISEWSASEPADLIFANASLQWVPDHPRLMPRLLGALTPGGALAVQMPDNLEEASHVLMRETALEPRFAALIGDPNRLRRRILSEQRYYDLLAPLADVMIWRTTYYHPLERAAEIVQWLRSTGLRPFLEPLAPEFQAQFLDDYERRLESAYPGRADGKRLLAFPRLFIVARPRPPSDCSAPPRRTDLNAAPLQCSPEFGTT
ncbi:MAG: trans-aconitate 2-methyltransferase [Steroidobacteraceae bacterium]